jgi:hypothetical protein
MAKVEHKRISPPPTDMPVLEVTIQLSRNELDVLNELLIHYDTLPVWLLEKDHLTKDKAETLRILMRHLYYELPSSDMIPNP